MIRAVLNREKWSMGLKPVSSVRTETAIGLEAGDMLGVIPLLSRCVPTHWARRHALR